MCFACRNIIAIITEGHHPDKIGQNESEKERIKEKKKVSACYRLLGTIPRGGGTHHFLLDK